MLGEKVFTEGKKELNASVEPGASLVFRHRVLVLTGQATPDAVEQRYRAFTGS